MEIKDQNLVKGEDGESWVDSAVELFGWGVLRMDWWQHSVDRLIYKNGKAYLLQTKLKEPRIHYPDTGLEKNRYDKFKQLCRDTGLRGLILFTDLTGNVYGEFLDLLVEESHGGDTNTKNGEQMIYFWMKDLR